MSVTASAGAGGAAVLGRPHADAGVREGELRESVERRYVDIRRMAAWIVRRSGRQHLVQPTALVHETYIRMMTWPPPAALPASAFLPLVARVMRQALIDIARSGDRQRRGHGWRRVDERDVVDRRSCGPEIQAELREALEDLRSRSARQASILEMHCVGRMTLPEVAHAMGLGLRTTEKEWSRASTFVRRHASTQRILPCDGRQAREKSGRCRKEGEALSG